MSRAKINIDKVDLVKKIDYIEKDETEMIGGYYGVTFVYQNLN